MIRADLHVHSYFSTDSEEPLENAVLAAINAGLKTMCMTEHMDMDFPGGGFMVDTEAYKSELFSLREKYADRIELLFGIELGLMDYLAQRLYEYTAGQKFDFIIGSSHLVDGMDPYEPEYFDKYGDKNGILRYFESILANISVFDDFDVYGHPDYAVRYCKAKSYKPVDYRELGGEIITVGSDGHKGEHIAYDFRKAEEILRSAGFEYYTVFRQRKAEFVKI